MILKPKIVSLTVFFLFMVFSESVGQEIRLENPSFEGKPTTGIISLSMGYRSDFLESWEDCGLIFFPTASPPDVHGLFSNKYSTEQKSIPEGNTYLTLVTRKDGSFESISQELYRPLIKDSIYYLTIQLSQSNSYLSHTDDNRINEINFVEPCILEIWGGDDFCSDNELLYRSVPVDHCKWKRYKIYITPKEDVSFLTFAASHSDQDSPEYSNLCLDNLSAIELISKDEVFGISQEEERGINPGLDTTLFMRREWVKDKINELENKEKQPPAPVGLSLEQSYSLDVYTEARKYGLYRYVKSLDSVGQSNIITHLDSLELDHSEWYDAIQLSKDVDSAGYTPENLKKMNFFNNAQGWRNSFESYLIENEIPLKKKN